MTDRACHMLTVGGDVAFKIVTGPGDRDPISQQIQEGTWTFPPLFELGFALMQPGHCVLDLGAHIGTFALAAAARGCRVIAIEASPYNASLLKESAARNGYENLLVISAAVSDHAGTLQFVEAGPFGLIANPQIQSPTIQVPAITVDGLLDELGWDHVDLIKMDVEGSEIAALRGMSHLLNSANVPVILYESNGFTLSIFHQTPKDLVAATAKFGYDNYLVEPGRLVPVGLNHLQVDCNVDHLAVKPPFVAPRGWKLASPLGRKEAVARIVAACTHPHEHHRTYTARALAEANGTILGAREVQHALSLLKDDPHPDVRTAASWWGGPPETVGAATAQTLPHPANAALESPSDAALASPDRLLSILADEIKAHSDVMLRGYVVRSRIPLLGALVAWTRRNLTSHLREPYLDPTLERQVEVNRCIADWLQMAAKALDAAARRQADMEGQIRALEVKVQQLTAPETKEEGEP